MEPAASVPAIDSPVRPPYPPTQALAVDALPPGVDWFLEPKSDGFRCLAFRDGDRVVLQSPPGFTGGAPSGPSRWSAGRNGEWKPLAPRLVCEVRYDHFSGGRFRHGTMFLRWRPDKAPRLCTVARLEGGLDESLAKFWGRRAG